MSSLSAFTDFPGIYETTYWGRMPSACYDNALIDADIMKHRNAFVTTFRISECCTEVPFFVRDAMASAWHDHKEVYVSRDLDAYVCVSHPYVHDADHRERLREQAKVEAFQEYECMYAKNAISLYKIIK